jgi:selenide,water dikinase
MQVTYPVVKDLVLVGGGHSHVLLLRQLGMTPIPGLRVTLVSPEYLTPYSGMLPGVVAGHYTPDDIHIDLAPLCRFAGAQFIQARVTDFDPYSQRIEISGRPDLSYDALSLDIGITPNLDVPGAAEHVIPVKPIGEFLEQWQGFLKRYLAGEVNSLALVGGGAGGVELMLAIHTALTSLKAPLPEFHLVAASGDILPEFNSDVQGRFIAELRARNIQLHTGARVSEVTAAGLKNDFGGAIAADAVFWVTSAASQGWLKKTGLTLTDDGFVVTSETLQSVNFASVFAAGDIAFNRDYPRPKAGVFAVRQGPMLYENIKRFLLGKAPKAFKPQKEFLSLISTGGRAAVGSRGRFTVQGNWVWKWKNWIDQKFMKQFHQLPRMVPEKRQGLLSQLDEQMRCGGCGAKVSADLLTEVLRDVGINPGSLDDAALYAPPPGKHLLHTLDHFKTFTPDNYRFARIAVQHALSDIYAMGGEPVTALANITVPYGTPGKIRNTLEQIIAGSQETLQEAGVALVGGHTSEGAELSLGFAVNGLVDPDRSLRKGGLKVDQVLILTKPIGTGTILAADMQYAAKGAWVEAAHIMMEQSNGEAAKIFSQFSVSACTDVTGFGLAGHLLEMLNASHCAAVITLEALPILPGAAFCVNQLGIKSTLHDANREACSEVSLVQHRYMPLVFDPQTSGGLLAGVAEDQAAEVLAALHQAGYAQAAVIGRVSSSGQSHLFFE